MAAPLKRPLRLPVRAEPIVHWQHAERIAAESGRQTCAVTCDVTDEEDVARAFAQVE